MILIFSIFILCAKDKTGQLVFERLYHNPSLVDIFLIAVVSLMDLFFVASQELGSYGNNQVQTDRVIILPNTSLSSNKEALYHVHERLKMEEKREEVRREEARQRNNALIITQKMSERKDIKREVEKQEKLIQKKIDRKDTHNHFLLSDLLARKINEEGQAFLIDKTLEWEKVGLAPNKINRNKILFILFLYWGMLIAWIQLTSIRSRTRIK
jgi:hypothetical protein